MLNSKKYLYFPINKCATTTFKNIFKKYNHILIPNLNLNQDTNKNLHLLKLDFKNYFKFTIIRHPIQRFLSAVNMFIRDKKLDKTTAIKKVIEIMKNHDAYSLNGNKNNYIKRHTLPMTHDLYCLLDENKNLNIDLIIDVEKLKDNQELKNFLEKIEIDPTTVLDQVNKTEKYIVFNDLTNDDLNFLYKYYVNDFIIFNYK
jgi:hypothetical protein